MNNWHVNKLYNRYIELFLNVYIIKLSQLGDILAIPFCIVLIYYFHTIQNRTNVELLLYLFSICGLIADVLLH